MTKAMTESLVPTDAEIEILWQDSYPNRFEAISFARAILAKWGAPPAGAQERQLTELQKDATELLFALQKAWPYVHVNCTIKQRKEEILTLLRKHGEFADFWEQEKAPAQPSPQPLPALRDALDAARYRWLRHGDNDEKVLKAYTSRPSEPGEPTMFLPRTEELDRLIDAARAAQEE